MRHDYDERCHDFHRGSDYNHRWDLDDHDRGRWDDGAYSLHQGGHS